MTTIIYLVDVFFQVESSFDLTNTAIDVLAYLLACFIINEIKIQNCFYWLHHFVVFVPHYTVTHKHIYMHVRTVMINCP